MSDTKEGVPMIHENLKRRLEEKAKAVAQPSSGSFHIGEFTMAKVACLDAGVPQAEVDEVIDRVASRRRS